MPVGGASDQGGACHIYGYLTRTQCTKPGSEDKQKVCSILNMNPGKQLSIHVSEWSTLTDSILTYIRTTSCFLPAEIAQHLKIPVGNVRVIVFVMLTVGIVEKIQGRAPRYKYTGTYQLRDPMASKVGTITVHVLESLATRCRFELCNTQVKSIVSVLLRLGLLQQENSTQLRVTLTKKGWDLLDDHKEILPRLRRRLQYFKHTPRANVHAVVILEFIRNSPGCTSDQIVACLNINRDMVCHAIHVLLSFEIVERNKQSNDAYIYKYLGGYRLCNKPISPTATMAVHAIVSAAVLGKVPFCHKGSTKLVLHLVSLGLLKWENQKQLSLTEVGWMILERSKGMHPNIRWETQYDCMCTNIFGLPDEDADHVQPGDTTENLTDQDCCENRGWHAYEAGELCSMSAPIHESRQELQYSFNTTETLPHVSYQVPCPVRDLRTEGPAWHGDTAGELQYANPESQDIYADLSLGSNATKSLPDCSYQMPFQSHYLTTEGLAWDGVTAGGLQYANHNSQDKHPYWPNGTESIPYSSYREPLPGRDLRTDGLTWLGVTTGGRRDANADMQDDLTDYNFNKPAGFEKFVDKVISSLSVQHDGVSRKSL